MSTFRHLIVSLALLVSLAMGAPRKSVLILHEGFHLLPYQALMNRELQEDLSSNARFEGQLFEEYLDDWRLKQDVGSLAAALEAKYTGRAFDVVIADGAGALRLLVNNPPDFIRSTPVVFVSVLDVQMPPKLPANITGVDTHRDIAATIRLAQTLQPDLQNLYYIESDPLHDVVRDRALPGEFQSFRGRLDIVLWERDELGVLLKKVSDLPPHSAVLFDSYFEDPHGQIYIPAKICALVAASSNAPVYTLYQTMIGSGALGGVVVNFNDIGRQASIIVLALLKGGKISDFPVLRSRNEVMIDWRELVRFRIPEKYLPSSAIVLYRELSLWARYRWYFIFGAIVFLLQTALISKLAIAEKKRKRSEKATRELAGRLIRAQEEERRRIARELHDDLSQRLSLLCLKLDTLRASPPESSEILTQQLTVLYDETDVLSSDIHQFSHKLHPASLEKLGLTAALRRYCSEFSAHRKIAVDLQVSGEEPSLQQETALTLFRVGQECLMNVAKHSSVVSCEVRLNYTRDRVLLEVRDKGSGFELDNLPEKAGLGLESMRERLRSIGGTLLVESARSRGTRVRAEIPISAAPTDGMSRESENTAAESPNVSAV